MPGNSTNKGGPKYNDSPNAKKFNFDLSEFKKKDIVVNADTPCIREILPLSTKSAAMSSITESIPTQFNLLQHQSDSLSGFFIPSKPTQYAYNILDLEDSFARKYITISHEERYSICASQYLR